MVLTKGNKVGRALSPVMRQRQAVRKLLKSKPYGTSAGPGQPKVGTVGWPYLNGGTRGVWGDGEEDRNFG